MKDNEITLKIPASYLIDAFKNVFKEEYADTMSELIVGVLQEKNQKGLEMIFKASLGIVPVFRYKKDDMVLVEHYSLSSWNFNIDEMEEKGLAINKNVKSKIIDINKFSEEPYTVKYSYWDSSEQVQKTNTTNVSASSIKGYVEELPEI